MLYMNFVLYLFVSALFVNSVHISTPGLFTVLTDVWTSLSALRVIAPLSWSCLSLTAAHFKNVVDQETAHPDITQGDTRNQ